MNKEISVNNMAYCKRVLVQARQQKMPHVMVIKPQTEKRRDIQNRLMWHWYKELSEQYDRHGMRKNDLIKYNKLTFGVPILRRDEDFNNTWSAIDHLTYEQKISIMHYMPITSIMTIKQMTEFLNDFKNEWSQQGCVLSTSDDLYYAAMGLKR